MWFSLWITFKCYMRCRLCHEVFVGCVSVCHMALLYKHHWMDWGPAWRGYSCKYLSNQRWWFRFSEPIWCGLCQITLASCCVILPGQSSLMMVLARRLLKKKLMTVMTAVRCQMLRRLMMLAVNNLAVKKRKKWQKKRRRPVLFMQVSQEATVAWRRFAQWNLQFWLCVICHMTCRPVHWSFVSCV